MLEEIQELHKQGCLEEAKQAYLELIEINPREVRAWHLLGILYAEEGNLNEAEKMLLQAIQLNPEDNALHLHVANILKAKGLYDEAVNVLLELTETYPDYAAAFNNLGTIYFLQQKNPEALSAYQTAVALQPNYVDAYYNLGLALAKSGQRVEAVNTYRAIIELSPLHPGAHFQLGCLLLESHQLPEALAQFSIIEKEHPFHVETQSNLALVYLRLGKLDEAKVHYIKALELTPHDSQIAFNLGVISMQQGLVKEAVDFYLQAVNSDADFYAAHHNLGFIFLATKNKVAALRHFDEVLRLRPHDEATRHTIKILKGDTSLSGSPPEYIRSLFDSYADHFDAHLLQALHYQVPQLFYNLVQTVAEAKQAKWDILDLGCGTGLSGDVFKGMAKTLVGVDMSEKMLEEAAKKNSYDKLVQADLLSFLANQQEKYDLILAADVLVYFGELAAVFPAVASALRVGGLFVFDAEISLTDDYHMTESGRFVHNKSYLAKLISQSQLTILDYQVATLRTQNAETVQGHLYLLQKQA